MWRNSQFLNVSSSSGRRLSIYRLSDNSVILFIVYLADVAELADAPDLGSGVYDVQVQVLSSAFYLSDKDCKETYHFLCTPLAEKQRTSSFFK